MTGLPDPAGPSVEEVLRVASLTDLAWGPMDGKEAAAFLEVSEGQFGHLAPGLPRHEKTGLGYRYLRSELLAWLTEPAWTDPSDRYGQAALKEIRR